MNRHVKAQAPILYKLAQQSRYASHSVEASTTLFTKKANVVNLDGINHLLVSEAIKLGSAVLQSISATAEEDQLSKQKNSIELEDRDKEGGFDIKRSLITGAALSAVPVLAANYTLNKANEDLDAKMMAIPGLAAATVGAILAAKKYSEGNNYSPSISPSTRGLASELESALNAKEVVDSAIESSDDSEISEDLQKMSSISTEHIAYLISEILV